MSERVAKVESLIRQVVAESLRQELGPDAVRISVTRVDAAPDLRNAIVWLGVLGNDEKHMQELFDLALEHIGAVQRELASRITTKFVPRLTFKLDTGGQYAQQIGQILKSI